MEERHAVFGFVEEGVGEVLLPDLGAGGGHVAETDYEEVHVEGGDLEPGVEGGGETEGWISESELLDRGHGGCTWVDLLSYQYPDPWPISSPASFLGTSPSFSKACGTV